jgi:hypothetical protein
LSQTPRWCLNLLRRQYSLSWSLSVWKREPRRGWKATGPCQQVKMHHKGSIRKWIPNRKDTAFGLDYMISSCIWTGLHEYILPLHLTIRSSDDLMIESAQVLWLWSHLVTLHSAHYALLTDTVGIKSGIATACHKATAPAKILCTSGTKLARWSQASNHRRKSASQKS